MRKNMTLLSIWALLALFSLPVFGQEKHKAIWNTDLPKRPDMNQGGPMLKYVQWAGNSGMLFGGQGVSVYQDWLIGGAGFGGNINNLTVGYGGFIFGKNFQPEQIINYSVYALLGGGGITSNTVHTGFYIIEPAADLNINFFPNIKGTIGASYQFSSAINQAGLDNLNSLAWHLAVKFEQY